MTKKSEFIAKTSGQNLGAFTQTEQISALYNLMWLQISHKINIQTFGSSQHKLESCLDCIMITKIIP